MTKTEQLKDWPPATGTVWQTAPKPPTTPTAGSRTATDVRGNTTATDLHPGDRRTGHRGRRTTNPLGWTSTANVQPVLGVGRPRPPTPTAGSPRRRLRPARPGVARLEAGLDPRRQPDQAVAQYTYTFAPNRRRLPVRQDPGAERRPAATSRHVPDLRRAAAAPADPVAALGGGDRVVTDTFYDAFGRAATSYARARRAGRAGRRAVVGAGVVGPVGQQERVRRRRPGHRRRSSSAATASPTWSRSGAPPPPTGRPHHGHPAAGRHPHHHGHRRAGPHRGAARVHHGGRRRTAPTPRPRTPTTARTSRPRSPTPPGNDWTYTYDLRGRQIPTRPTRTAGTTTTGYNDYDEVDQHHRRPRQKLAYTYDALGRKTAVRDDAATGPLRAAWTYDTPLQRQPASAAS